MIQKRQNVTLAVSFQIWLLEIFFWVGLLQIDMLTKWHFAQQNWLNSTNVQNDPEMTYLPNIMNMDPRGVNFQKMFFSSRLN